MSAGACVVLPEGTESRIVQAAVACAQRGIARSVLLGPPDQVAELARSLGLQLPDGVTVVDHRVAERYVAPLAELRRHKGWTEEMARDHLADPIMVGTMMLKQDEVDGIVAGAVHTTAATVRPALQILGTRPGSRLVSSVFFMCLPDEVVVYGDCASNPRPGAEDLADIAIQSAASARAFGVEPRVAMISFSTGTSGTGSDVDKVVEATRIVREREPDLAVDGPLQYDAAAIASVGHSKRPGSAVAGRATVFVFPDLDTGNTTYKAVQRSAQVVSVGPMLQGLAKPVNDLSRGVLVDDIVLHAGAHRNPVARRIASGFPTIVGRRAVGGSGPRAPSWDRPRCSDPYWAAHSVSPALGGDLQHSGGLKCSTAGDPTQIATSVAARRLGNA